ncbi:MAG: threonylcarbamoyl-AMP synthase [Armatimonadetes bacterium]|nr:threonylcarbamoyl-AMP synthase [Armatimonadota bacterium]
MNLLSPTRENLLSVATALLAGQNAILPTETVYGLAADATNEDAVRNIFALKGRPADNPLIVHVSSLKQASAFVLEFPEIGNRLAEAFMPGPLTLVVRKRPTVSDIVTGGLDTVAIRMPDHPVCLAVMELGNIALAMPSANPFMGLSPTRIDMVDAELAEKVFAVVDGGPCPFGIESTVVDITGEPSILRPGSISRQEIEAVLDQPVSSSASQSGRRSPGQYRRHYSPKTRCSIVAKLALGQPGLTLSEASLNQIQMPTDPKEYARLLYASMAELDSLGLTEFGIEAPPEDARWTAVWDRLIKATATA